MAIAFIICPYTLIDLLDRDNEFSIIKNQQTQIFLDLLSTEGCKVCTLESKRYRGFMPLPVYDFFTDIIVEHLTIKDEPERLKKLEVLATLHSIFERAGTMKDCDYFESVMELARELDDEYTVYIVSNPKHKGKIVKSIESLKKKGKKFGYDKFQIIDINTAITKMINT